MHRCAEAEDAEEREREGCLAVAAGDHRKDDGAAGGVAASFADHVREVGVDRARELAGWRRNSASFKSRSAEFTPCANRWLRVEELPRCLT